MTDRTQPMTLAERTEALREARAELALRAREYVDAQEQLVHTESQVGMDEDDSARQRVDADEFYLRDTIWPLEEAVKEALHQWNQLTLAKTQAALDVAKRRHEIAMAEVAERARARERA